MEKTRLIILFFALMLIGCATTSQAKMSTYESRKSYVNAQSKLSSEMKEAILKGKVIDGMTKNDVLAIWGEPNKKYKYSEHKRAIDATDEKINDEAWYYDCFFCFPPHKFVRFGVDGLVNYVSIDYK